MDCAVLGVIPTDKHPPITLNTSGSINALLCVHTLQDHAANVCHPQSHIELLPPDPETFKLIMGTSFRQVSERSQNNQMSQTQNSNTERAYIGAQPLNPMPDVWRCLLCHGARVPPKPPARFHGVSIIDCNTAERSVVCIFKTVPGTYYGTRTYCKSNCTDFGTGLNK